MIVFFSLFCGLLIYCLQLKILLQSKMPKRKGNANLDDGKEIKKFFKPKSKEVMLPESVDDNEEATT